MPQQSYLAKIHILFKETGMLAFKRDIVSSFCSSGSESSRHLTDTEALELITYLDSLKVNKPTEIVAAHNMKLKLIAMAHELGWKMPNGKINIKSLDDWCLKFSYLRKKMDDYTYRELPKLITQFEQGPYRSFLKRI